MTWYLKFTLKLLDFLLFQQPAGLFLQVEEGACIHFVAALDELALIAVQETCGTYIAVFLIIFRNQHRILILQIFLQICLILLAGSLLLDATDFFGNRIQTIDNIHTLDIGRNHIYGFGARFILKHTELSTGKIFASIDIVLEQANTVNVGYNLIGRSGKRFVLTCPRSVSLIETVAVGGIPNCGGSFYNCFIFDLYCNWRIELGSRIFGKVYRVSGNIAVSVSYVADSMILKPRNSDTELVIVKMHKIPLCIITVAVSFGNIGPVTKEFPVIRVNATLREIVAPLKLF